MQLERVHEAVAEIKKEIEKCQKVQTCLDRVAERIQRETVSLPDRIHKEVEEVVHRIETIQTTELAKCGTEAVTRVQAKGKALLTKISTCVNGKIGH